MLIGIDYLQHGKEWPILTVAASRDAAESWFRREHPHMTLVRSWVYPDECEQAYVSITPQPHHPRKSQ